MKLPHFTFLQGIITRSITCTLRMQLKAAIAPPVHVKTWREKSNDVDAESRGARTVSSYKSGSRIPATEIRRRVCACARAQGRTRAHGKHGDPCRGT